MVALAIKASLSNYKMKKLITKLGSLSLTLVLVLMSTMESSAQYDPAGGEPGSLGVHVNSGKITSWCSDASVNRGWVDIADTPMGKVVLGNPPDVYSKADRFVMSLGDGGSATIHFNTPLTNFAGPDFAIFENGFAFQTGYFLELAFVEVSANGKDFIRFPAVSLTDTLKQRDNGSILDPTKLKNLAGKHQAEYGTPFDLDELKDTLKDQIDSIKYIRIVDVVGSLVDSLARYDSKGNKVNDPWPTPFNSGGFDLDAVAILGGVTGIEHVSAQSGLYPNPARSGERISCTSSFDEYTIYNMAGNAVQHGHEASSEFYLSELTRGIYIVEFRNGQNQWVSKLSIR